MFYRSYYMKYFRSSQDGKYIGTAWRVVTTKSLLEPKVAFHIERHLQQLAEDYPGEKFSLEKVGRI